MKIAISHLNFDEILSEFHGSVQKCPNSLRIVEKMRKNPTKIRSKCKINFLVPEKKSTLDLLNKEMMAYE